MWFRASRAVFLTKICISAYLSPVTDPLVPSRPLLHRLCRVTVLVRVLTGVLAFLDVNIGEGLLDSGAYTSCALSDCFPGRLFLSPPSSPAPSVHHSNPCSSEVVERAVPRLL